MNLKKQAVVVFLAISLLEIGCSKSSAPSSSQNNASPPSAPAQPAAPPSNAPPNVQQSDVGPTSPPPPAPPPASSEPAAVPSVPMAEPAPPKPVIVPAGTAIPARITDTLSSKSSQAGDPFVATVSSPVKVHASVLIPAGSRINGVVTVAKSAGRFKGAASLSISARSVVIGGRTFPIHVSSIGSETNGKGKRTAGFVGGGAGGGALIGGIAGGGKGALIGGLVGAGAGTAGAGLTGNNRDITLPAESAVTFYLSSPLKLGNSSQQSASDQ